jgi:hypothetical protein
MSRPLTHPYRAGNASARVESAANSAEFSKQVGHGKLQTLWMVWVLPQRWSALEEHVVYIEPCATIDTTAAVSTQVIRSLELWQVQCPAGLAWRRLVSKHDLATLTEDKLGAVETASTAFTHDDRLQEKGALSVLLHICSTERMQLTAAVDVQTSAKGTRCHCRKLYSPCH